jgi:hypothetical protein
MVVSILDVESIERLNRVVKITSDTMADIDQQVINHIQAVKRSLETQLHRIQMKLDEVEKKLDQAESAESACHASQHRDNDGRIVPSCSYEENVAAAARKEAEKWRRKYQRAQQIYDVCQQEIADYISGGHEFIRDLCDLQATKVSQLLSVIYDKMQDVLSTNLAYPYRYK